MVYKNLNHFRKSSLHKSWIMSQEIVLWPDSALAYLQLLQTHRFVIHTHSHLNILLVILLIYMKWSQVCLCQTMTMVYANDDCDACPSSCLLQPPTALFARATGRLRHLPVQARHRSAYWHCTTTCKDFPIHLNLSTAPNIAHIPKLYTPWNSMQLSGEIC